MQIVIIIGCLLILLVISGYHNQKREREALLQRLLSEYGNVPDPKIKRIACLGTLEDPAVGGAIDQITWNDLSLTDVYQRINYTHTSAGAQRLFDVMAHPAMSKEPIDAQDALTEKLTKDRALFQSIVPALHEIGYTGKYTLQEYLAYLTDLPKESMAKMVLLDLLYLPAIALFALTPMAGVGGLFAVIALNLTYYFRKKAILMPYLGSFAYILRMVRAGRRVEDALRDLPEKQLQIRADLKELSAFSRGSSLAMSLQGASSSNPLDLLLDYLRMLFHFDLMKFYQMLEICREKEQTIRDLVAQIAALDLAQSIACYRASLATWCKPDLQQGCALSVVNVKHPLLSDAVANSIQVGEKQVLITGSNASGKSTFLKTVAVNAILAQAIGTVSAETWQGDCYRIFSSMALRDDLLSGDSFYMSEIKALKRVLDAALPGMASDTGTTGTENRAGIGNSANEENRAGGEDYSNAPILCFIDEVLKGTNTVERIAASGRILRYLGGQHAVVFAATHDIELTSLLADCYENYHFTEEVQDQIVFSYRLMEGRSTTRNAIRLLSMIGMPKEITDAAEADAAFFLTHGKWE